MSANFRSDGGTAYLMLAAFNAGESITNIAADFSVSEDIVTAQLQAIQGSGIFTAVPDQQFN